MPVLHSNKSILFSKLKTDPTIMKTVIISDQNQINFRTQFERKKKGFS